MLLLWFMQQQRCCGIHQYRDTVTEACCHVAYTLAAQTTDDVETSRAEAVDRVYIRCCSLKFSRNLPCWIQFPPPPECKALRNQIK
ncbi:hypothetical protein Y032_0085g1811 [Ancylostoma ceylanicum]|uniref:Uncharacterized protein n=1 Tax=Ancylostoma ceylanicum TaxID=53326 RepID=A0A016TPW0_9BILA|nr:hypothetical protein Y032_0085g1811 [Ancylostoma ceylanicum]